MTQEFGKFLGIITIGTAVLVGTEAARPIMIDSKKGDSEIEQAIVRIGGVSLITEVARDGPAQQRGLSKRESLDPALGMLFAFSSRRIVNIWMKEVRFPLDIFWISGGRVVRIENSVPVPDPKTPDPLLPVYRAEVPVEYVLETNAGFAKTHGIEAGDEVVIGFPGSVVKRPKEKGEEYFIETLREKKFNGDDFAIGGLIHENDTYRKYSISYRSGGLMISGVMGVPRAPSGTRFPLLILNHGLIPKEIYFSGRGSKREQDFFARHGYVIIHPDYRGLGASSPDPSPHHDFYQGYTEDVVNLLEALHKAKPDFIDLNRIGMWGHSMGGGIAARVMALRRDVKAYVLFAPISADAKDNFYELSDTERLWLDAEYGTGPEADKTYAKISPINYFNFVSAPVEVHHGMEDRDVPILFSQKIADALNAHKKPVEFFTYPGEAHEFINAWPRAIKRSLRFFDQHLKGQPTSLKTPAIPVR